MFVIVAFVPSSVPVVILDALKLLTVIKLQLSVPAFIRLAFNVPVSIELPLKCETLIFEASSVPVAM